MTNTDICVQSTMDYSIVKHMMGNRVVNPSNVEKIKLSMSSKQLVVPAILNGRMEVIDGQHRLEACKQLGKPFYFIIVEGYSLNEVQMVNANMKNWNNDDFLESFIELYKCGQNEFANYVILRDFCKKHEMPLATALILSDPSPSSLV